MATVNSADCFERLVYFLERVSSEMEVGIDGVKCCEGE